MSPHWIWVLRRSILLPTCLEISLFCWEISRQVGRTDKRDSATVSILVWEASFSLRAWDSPPQPKDPKVGTTGKKDTATTGLVLSLFGYVGLSCFSPTQETQGQMGGTGKRGPAVAKGTFWEACFSLWAQDLPLLLRDTWKLRGNLGPSQTFPTKRHLATLLLPPQAALAGTSRSPVAPDKQSKPNKTTKALKINLPFEQ